MSPAGCRSRPSRARSRPLTFLANRANDRYLGRLPDAELADRIALACGHKGPSAEYLFRTVEACEALGIPDRHLWNLQALVAQRLREQLNGASGAS